MSCKVSPLPQLEENLKSVLFSVLKYHFNSDILRIAYIDINLALWNSFCPSALTTKLIRHIKNMLLTVTYSCLSYM